MSADIADKLRALTRDHVEGRSTLQSYRRLRAPLLNGLVAPAGGASPDATKPRAVMQGGGGAQAQPRPVQPPAVPAAAAPPAATPPAAAPPSVAAPPAAQPPAPPLAPPPAAPAPSPAAPPPAAQRTPAPSLAAKHPAEVTQPRAAALASGEGATSEPSSGSGVGLGRITGIAVVAVVVALAVVFIVWRHHSTGVAAPQTAATADGGQAQPAGQADPIRALLQPLLESPDWSDSRLVALNEQLLEAGRPRIDAVRDTDWFDAVVDRVRSRLLQQQALSSTPLTPDSSPLAALAVTLGIDLATATTGPEHVATAGAERETRPSNAAAPTQDASPAATPERTSEQARGAQAGASDASTPPHVRSESSPPPTHLASRAGPGSAAAPHAGSSRTTAAASSAPVSAVAAGASTAAAATESSSKTSVHHPYPACSPALGHVRLNYCQDFLDSGEAAPLLVLIPSGSFMMGSGESAAEGPVHQVTLAHDFAMTAYEVSQSEFQLYCRASGKDCPAQPWSRADDPVVNVSWNDAQDYAKWLSGATHQRYRLPTEAEWEYAARAGRTGLYPSGDTLSPTDAYFSMGPTLTAPAPRSMRFNANAWHLMHMVGNVREWVEDAWNPTFAGAPADGSARSEGESGTKVVRGGCYADPAIKLRLTTREPLAADGRDRCTGIRLVRDVH